MNHEYPSQAGSQPGVQPSQYAGQPPSHPQPGQAPGALAGSTLRPASGAAKALYIGLVLMLVSFGIKQLVFDWSLQNSGNLLQKEKISAKMSNELAEIDAALDPIEAEIEDLQAKASKPPKAADDDDDDAPSDNKKETEKLAKLKKDRDKQNEALEDKRKAVRTKYRGLLREAGRAQSQAMASGLGGAQFALLAKLLLDLLKIGGAALCVLSGLRISADPEQPAGLKVYAAVIGGAAFFGVVVGGVAALLG